MFEAPRQITTTHPGIGGATAGLAPLAAIDFREIGSIIWHGKAIIASATAIALVLAAILVLIIPHRFTATTQILIEPTDLRAVGNELTPANPVSDAALMQIETQVRVLTSDNVLRRVVKEQGLDHDPEYVGTSPLRHLANDLLAALGRANPAALADKTLAALIELKRHVQVTRPERTFVVDVSVTSTDPAKAARLANAIAQSYLAEQTRVRADAARQVSQSLMARLNELKDRVREAEDRVVAFKASHNIIDANGQLINEQQLADMNNELAAARARMALAKARLDQIEAVQHSKADTGAFPEAVQSPTITALRSQYAEIMRREAEQMSSLGPRHPAVIEIEAQAQRLQHMIGDEINRLAVSARTAYESAKTNEDLLARNLEALKQNTITTNQAMVGLRELERDVQASRTVYEAFLVRARETGEQERIDTKNIQVISRADLPLRRSSPPSNLLIALAAALLGAAAGTGIVIMRARSPAVVPRSRDRKAFAGPALLAAATDVPRLASAVPVLAVVPGVDVAFGLHAVDDPTSRFATAIRNVLEALRATPGKRGNPSVLLLAGDHADDASAVALTLAAVAAASQKVLLIDADVERRTLSAIDADRSEAGLVDVAIGRRVLADVIVRDRETNINLASFIAPKSRRDGPISDSDVKHAFEQTKRFDMVIVAAMDGCSDPGARFFAGVVDHIVIVASIAEADAGAIDASISSLGLEARKVRGAVLTGAEAA